MGCINYVKKFPGDNTLEDEVFWKVKEWNARFLEGTFALWPVVLGTYRFIRNQALPDVSLEEETMIHYRYRWRFSFSEYAPITLVIPSVVIEKCKKVSIWSFDTEIINIISVDYHTSSWGQNDALNWLVLHYY